MTSILLGVLIGLGMVFTVWDWRQWRIEEMRHYGQGREENKEIAPARKLERVYSNQRLKFRIKYPKGWQVKDMIFSEPRGQVKMVVSVEEDGRDLPVIGDEMAEGVTQQRDYINTETASWVVLTWQGARETRQVAVAKKEDRLYKIEIIGGNGIWKSWSATFGEIYRSVVLL